MIWFQQAVVLRARSRGVHLVTQEVFQGIDEIDEIERGLVHVFIQHTSASLTLNENADPDVRVDMETALNHLCPESMPFIHTIEGPDDMPAHVKASLMGNSLSLPISVVPLSLKTWQGIYLCEHRDRGGSRRLMVTGFGQSRSNS